jgi:hypothetical protein
LLYRVLADLVVVIHLAFVAFVAVGSLLVSKWTRLLWPHLLVVGWQGRHPERDHRLDASEPAGVSR